MDALFVCNVDDLKLRRTTLFYYMNQISNHSKPIKTKLTKSLDYSILR